MSYYLIVDDEKEIAELMEMTLASKFKIDIELAFSGNEALNVIANKGVPELIISDYRMPDGDGYYLNRTLQEKGINSPFVICSSDPLSDLQRKFPGIYGYLEKPNMVDEMIEMVGAMVLKNNLTSPAEAPKYIPIRISHLMRLGDLICDLYMKLSEEKYVKVLKKGESFLQTEAERFYGKQLTHLYITKSDSDIFISTLRHNLEMISNAKMNSSEETSYSLESLELVERLSMELGWTPQLVSTAKQSINLAIKVVSSDPNIYRILKSRLSNPQSAYVQHTGTLAMLSCIFCYQLGWTSDSAQMKLAMSALMHDMALDDSYYTDIHRWNEQAINFKEKNPAIEKYRHHPLEAAKLIQAIKNLPPDIDQIIIQHHELPDGSGFPRGLASSRISPMTTVFIIAEDLLHFIENHDDLKQRLYEFVASRENIYTEGNFKRTFKILKHHLLVQKNN